MAEATTKGIECYIRTLQSSRMIFPLASLAGMEPKGVRRSQNPERSEIALLISLSGGGGRVCSGFAVPAILQNTIGRQRRGAGSGGSPAEMPQEGAILGGGGLPDGQCAEPRAAAVSFRLDRPASKAQERRATEQSHNQGITSVNHKSQNNK